MSTNEPLLEIRDLVLSFEAGIPILNGVSLDITEGSLTALVGESGCGKTITALSVCRLVPNLSQGGSIIWRNGGREMDLTRVSQKELLGVRGRQIAYIFQDPASSLNPVLRAGEQIQEVYQAHFDTTTRQARGRVLEFLRRARLQDPERVYRSFPHELSGGMRQRAMIAMALIANPKLLIADEPTTALDASTEAEIMDLIVRVQKESKLTTLFITHDLEQATRHADQIYVMRQGRVIERMGKGLPGFRAKEDYSKKLFAASLLHAKPKSFIEV